MQIIEETVKIYQAKDGIKFKDKYECQTYEKGIPYGNYYAKLSNLKTFEVTENHLKLIKHNVIEWVFSKDGYNTGYFYQNLNAPYGNTDLVDDIAEILGIEPDCSNEEGEKWFSESLEYFLVCHHIDMRILINILCQNLSIHKGKYERKCVYSSDWVAVG